MGDSYTTVKKKLGATFLEVIMEVVSRREVSMKQMESMAENLGGKIFHWGRKERGVATDCHRIIRTCMRIP